MTRIEPLAPEDTFDRFRRRHGFQVVVKERSLHSSLDGRRLPRWFVLTEPRVERIDGGLLCGICGDGDTPQEAIDDFAQRLLGQRLVIDAYDTGPGRSEFWAPNEWAES